MLMEWTYPDLQNEKQMLLTLAVYSGSQPIPLVSNGSKMIKSTG